DAAAVPGRAGGVGPWSPPAGGLLTGKRQRGSLGGALRGQEGKVAHRLDYQEAGLLVVDRLVIVAGARGGPPAQGGVAGLVAQAGGDGADRRLDAGAPHRGGGGEPGADAVGRGAEAARREVRGASAARTRAVRRGCVLPALTLTGGAQRAARPCTSGVASSRA